MKKILVLLSALVMMTACVSEKPATEAAEPINPVTEAAEPINSMTEAAESENPVTEAAESVNSVIEAEESVNSVTEAAEPINPVTGAEEDENIETVLTARPPTERYVTAEEFEEEMGYCLIIPEGAEEVSYMIENSVPPYPVGVVGFVLDGVGWKATVSRTDNPFYMDNMFEPYKMDFDELFFVPEDGQTITVHGARPDALRYFLLHFHSDTIKDIYDFNAYWYMEDEGLELTMEGGSEESIHKVPVEIFDPIFRKYGYQN